MTRPPAKKGVPSLDKVTADFVVAPQSKVSLKRSYDPSFRITQMSKEDYKSQLQEGIENLSEFQQKLYAQNMYGILIIFQAMDAAGKDGTIKHVMSGLDPQGVQVYSFKAPSSEELDHDYMWRCARALPERGRIGIFNRSYYEEVLVCRVHPEILERQNLPPETVNKNIWKRRFEEINNFEQYLTNNGIVVLKFFLNVSKDEQKKRFLERIEMPEKNWKFDAGDAKERQSFDEYLSAYQDCLSNTSTAWAPWHVIPADYKPFTRLAVSHIIYKRMKELKLRYPTISKAQKAQLEQARRILQAE